VNRAKLDRRIFDVLIASRDFDRARKEVDAYVARDPNDPRGLLYKAEIDFQTGRLDQALDGFGRYLEMQPKSAVGYYRRGTIYYVKSEWDKAIADLSQAAALVPTEFGYMHRKRLAGALEARGDVDEAISALQAILSELDLDQRSSPDALRVAGLLSEMLGRNKRYEAQRALATQYKNLRPTDPYWYNVLGQNAILTGNLHAASEYLQEACKLSNYAEAPAEAVMIAWIQSGDFDRAVDFAVNQVPEDRRQARVHLRWAQALAARGDQDAALPHFITALEMASSSPEVSGTVAAVMQNSLGPEKALQVARERIKSHPDDRTTKVLLASILHRSPDGQSEALEIWREMVASATSDAEKIVPLTAGAQLAHQNHDLKTARDFYEQLIAYYDRVWKETQDRRALNPLAAMLNNLAYLLAEDLNKPQLALPYAERAAEYASDSPAILDTLGWIQVKLGRYRDAIGTLSRAIERKQDTPEFHQHIAEAYIGEGHETAAAERELQRAYELAIAQEAAAKQAQNTLAAELAAQMQQQIERRAAELDFEVKPPPQAE
jgi:tetratricopeptide (TPR) repeat protein